MGAKALQAVAHKLNFDSGSRRSLHGFECDEVLGVRDQGIVAAGYLDGLAAALDRFRRIRLATREWNPRCLDAVVGVANPTAARRR